MKKKRIGPICTSRPYLLTLQSLARFFLKIIIIIIIFFFKKKGNLAPNYDDKFQNTICRLEGEVRSRAHLLGARPGSRLLDYACGTGLLSRVCILYLLRSSFVFEIEEKKIYETW